MVTKAHGSCRTHDTILVDVVQDVISKVGIRPFGMERAARWDQNVEQSVRQLHDQYAGDWNRAFVFEQALDLTKKVGLELAEREAQARQVKCQRSKPRKTEVQPSGSESGTARKAEKTAVETMAVQPNTGLAYSGLPSFSVQPGELELEVADRIEGDRSALDRVPISLGAAVPTGIFGRPLCTLGIGLMVGFVIGAFAGRLFFPRV